MSFIRQGRATEKYLTLTADPPWPQKMVGKYANPKHAAAVKLPYHTMSINDIAALPVAPMLAEGAHVWLWTTNQFLDAAFDVLCAWDVKYLTTITWVKPSGCGAWFAATTQHCLFGYYRRCRFPLRRYAPTHFHANPRRHSEKPEEFFSLVESISPPPRVELFARKPRAGWDCWGDEVDSTAEMGGSAIGHANGHAPPLS